MANLGGFAGGLAQGYQSGEKMKMAQQELDDNKGFRERQMKIMEADEAAKEVERKRETEFRDGADALQKQYYGPQQVQTGSQQVTNTDGTVTEQPIYQTVQKKVGDDPLHDLRYKIDMGAHLIKGDPKGVAEHMKFVQNAVDTQTGQDIEGAIAGNKDAFARLGKSQGFDPVKASFAADPKTGDPILDTGDGRKINLRNIAAGLSVKQAYESIRQAQQDAQTAALNKSTVGLHDKQGGYYEAEAAAMPAKTESYRASGNLANARAGLAGEQENLLRAKTESINNGTDPATSSAIFKASSNLAGAGLDGKPDVVTRAKIHQIGVSILQNKPEKTKMSPEMAATMGAEALRKIKTDITKSIDAEPKDAFKQRGFKTRDAYIQDAVDRTISKRFPTLQMTNLPSVGAIDTNEE